MRRAKPLGFVAAVAAALALSGAATTTAVAGSALPCVPKITKVGGKPALIECGPATATVKVAGRTYNFKNGFCEHSASSGEALGLTMGTVVETAKPGSAPYLDLTVSTPSVAAVNADYGGKAIVLDGLVTVKGRSPRAGRLLSASWAAGPRSSPGRGTATAWSTTRRDRAADVRSGGAAAGAVKLVR